MCSFSKNFERRKIAVFTADQVPVWSQVIGSLYELRTNSADGVLGPPDYGLHCGLTTYSLTIWLTKHKPNIKIDYPSLVNSRAKRGSYEYNYECSEGSKLAQDTATEYSFVSDKKTLPTCHTSCATVKHKAIRNKTLVLRYFFLIKKTLLVMVPF